MYFLLIFAFYKNLNNKTEDSWANTILKIKRSWNYYNQNSASVLLVQCKIKDLNKNGISTLKSKLRNLQLFLENGIIWVDGHIKNAM